MSINSNQHYKNVIYNKMLITSLFAAVLLPLLLYPQFVGYI